MAQHLSTARTAHDERTASAHVLSERDAAKYFNMSPGWFRAGRMRGRGPAYVRAGRTVRYLIRDLDAWLDRHRVETREAGR